MSALATVRTLALNARSRTLTALKQGLRKLRVIAHLELHPAVLVTAVKDLADRHLDDPVTERECLDVLDEMVRDLARRDPQRISIAGLQRALGLSFGAASKALARAKATPPPE